MTRSSSAEHTRHDLQVHRSVRADDGRRRSGRPQTPLRWLLQWSLVWWRCIRSLALDSSPRNTLQHSRSDVRGASTCPSCVDCADRCHDVGRPQLQAAFFVGGCSFTCEPAMSTGVGRRLDVHSAVAPSLCDGPAVSVDTDVRCVPSGRSCGGRRWRRPVRCRLACGRSHLSSSAAACRLASDCHSRMIDRRGRQVTVVPCSTRLTVERPHTRTHTMHAIHTHTVRMTCEEMAITAQM
jgi:hypothetical protein